MLRHVVMWKFNEGVDAMKVGEDIKVRLLSLCDSIKEVKRAEVVYTPLTGSTHELLLSMDVEDINALQKYAASDEHVNIVGTLIRPNTNSRVAFDYAVRGENGFS